MDARDLAAPLEIFGFHRLMRGALRDDEGDVVVLFVRAEALDLADGGGEDVGGREVRVLLERGDETVFAELFFVTR